MWRDKKVSVVFPTYNEKDSIRDAIEDFFACQHVDEIVVVNNNAADGTDDEVKPTKAVLVHEERQGYGHAIWLSPPLHRLSTAYPQDIVVSRRNTP